MKNLGLSVFAALLLGLPAAFAQAQSPEPSSVSAPGLVVDGDNDGVSDEVDDCPYTQPHTPVDVHGCPVGGDSDADGVPDAMDDCPYTVKGSVVDSHGCALDSDLDGVPDGLDRCPHSARGERVDADGCEPGTVLPPVKNAGSVSQPRITEPSVRPAAPLVRLLPPPAAPGATTTPEPQIHQAQPRPAAPATRSAPAPQIVIPAGSLRPAEASVPLAPSVPTETPIAPVPIPQSVSEPVPEPAISVESPTANSAAPHSGPLIVETIGSLRFSRGSAALSDHEMQRLQRVVNDVLPRLALLPGSGLYLTGYLQPGESDGLDRQRGEVVRRYLLSKGVPAERVRLSATRTAPRSDASGMTVQIQLLPLN